MPYTRSQARDDFEANTKSLKKVAKKVSYNSSPLNYEQKMLIFQSSIFLMSARIEEYSKGLIEKLIFNFRSKNALMNEIPENIRTKALIDKQLTHYKNYNYNSDERKLIDRVNCSRQYYDLLICDNKFSNSIQADNILSTNKYPSVKNLKILFFRLGIEDIFNEVARKGRKNYKNQLESFLSVRESIAHQAAPTLTYQDVERHLENLIDLINQIDRVVYSHIVKKSGINYWK